MAIPEKRIYFTVICYFSMFFRSYNLRSRASSVTASFDNLHIDSYDANFRPQHRRLHSGSSLNWNNKMLVMSETIPDELLESEGVVPTKKASASR